MTVLLIREDPAVLSAADRAAIVALAPEMRLVVTDDAAEIEAVLPEVEIATGHVPPALLVRMPNLRWYQQWGAGADWLLRHPEIASRDFILTNASGVHAIQISEHILALMLAFARCLPQAIRAQTRGEWERQERENLFELAGKTLVLIGVGAIGSRTAALAAALDVQVIGVRRNAGEPAPGVARMVGPDRLLEALPLADFVVLTIPLTPETRHMIGGRELRAMKPGAYIFNIGRGGTIDEAALIRALREGWIAGAGLDVFEKEPLPAGSPLWQMENVIVTAHYSGATPHYSERAMAIFLDNLRRYRVGEPLRNVVDRALGY
jgi:phosphoglycerate dehydrogenase-like enzyme